MNLRSLLKIGLGMALLAALLTAVTYSMLRAQGAANPTSVAGRTARTELREVSATVTTVELVGPINLHLKQGDVAALKVRGEQRLLANIATEQDGTTLRIGSKGLLLHPRRPIEVDLVLPSLHELVINGSGDSTADGFSGETLSLQLQGSGNLNFDGRYKNVEAGLHGSGDLKLNTGQGEKVMLEMVGSGSISSSGSCKELSAELTGSGKLDAEHLASDKVAVTLQGSGTSIVFARHSADLTVKGNGDIHVLGNPSDRNVSRSGSGGVSWVH
ncbi:head GIN domain-containing protein [Pseudoduganella violaceinigra]|uniref:head GIN domain-containing protein n=1 Tax=Pseudoduganella violaceinigra TaxID=246602 RepID=UPI00041EF60B|nr:head GIN domain-containing protein [Pseudoduganella violaceinigra]